MRNKIREKERLMRLHPEYGFNATIPRCFWCDGDKEEIVLLGAAYEKKAPRSGLVLDYEPCKACLAIWEQGVVIMEVVPCAPNLRPIGSGQRPTGNFMVLKREAVERMEIEPEALKKNVLSTGRGMVPPDLFEYWHDAAIGPDTIDLKKPNQES